MNRLLAYLGPQSLERLAVGLDSGRIQLPVTSITLAAYVASSHQEQAAAELDRLLRDGSVTDAREGALLLRLLAAERRETQIVRDRVELVWSGPKVMGEVSSRTDRVVERLFRSASKSVLLTTYNLDKPAKSQQLFAPLVRQMERHPQLRVQICLHIKWPKGAGPGPESLKRCLENFAASFRDEHWPGDRLPQVYYDPRSLKPPKKGEFRPVQHAKCIIVDDARALVTSANFSESAHHRNIEAGVLIEDATVAVRLRGQFELLMRSDKLRTLELVGFGA